MRGEIQKLAMFLGKELTGDQLDRLREALKFDNFEKNPAVNNQMLKKDDGSKFMRKGNQ